MTVYLSSQTCPKEIYDKLYKCGNTVDVFVVIAHLSNKGNTPFLDGAIVSASRRMMNGQS